MESSSNSSRRGLAKSARPMASISCSPPEIYPAKERRLFRRVGKYSQTSSTLFLTSNRLSNSRVQLTNRFSSTVR